MNQNFKMFLFFNRSNLFTCSYSYIMVLSFELKHSLHRIEIQENTSTDNRIIFKYLLYACKTQITRYLLKYVDVCTHKILISQQRFVLNLRLQKTTEWCRKAPILRLKFCMQKLQVLIRAVILFFLLSFAGYILKLQVQQNSYDIICQNSHYLFQK